jgi:hypothetical protein
MENGQEVWNAGSKYESLSSEYEKEDRNFDDNEAERFYRNGK